MNKILLLTAVFATASGPLRAQSAWLPERGQLVTTPGYSYQTFDEYFAGTTRSKLPDDLSQHTAFLNFEYGIFRDVAADLTLGYSRTRFRPPGSATLHSDGLTDTQFGLRYRVLDERDAVFAQQRHEGVGVFERAAKRLFAKQRAHAAAHTFLDQDRKSTRLNSSHGGISRMPSSA